MANTPPIFKHSNYPDFYDYNEGKIVKSNSEIIKKIEIENKFSEYVSVDMKSKRYGISGCCAFDELENSIITKELCDWQGSVKPIFTKEYENQVWAFDSEPWPDWLQFGDFDPAIGPCIGVDCPTFGDPYGSTEWLSLRIPISIVETSFTPTGDWAGTFAPNLPPINVSGTAVLYVLASDDGVSWREVGKSKIPTGPNDDALGDGGNIYTDPDVNQDFWRIQIYYNVPATPVIDGANPKQYLKFVVVDDPVQYEVKFNQAIFPTLNGGAGQFDYHLMPNPSYGVPYSAAAIAEYTDYNKPRFFKTCDDTYEDCWYCGMEPMYSNYTSTPDFPTQTPIGFQCVDDAECLTIEVVNQFGVHIENYPIILDGVSVGSTNENGIYHHKFINASIDNVHTLNICDFCFYTTGNCNQHYIKIEVNDPRAVEFCRPDKVKLVCSDVFPDIQIADEDEPEDTLTSWLCDNDGTNYYGCVEIIGNYGYETQAECEEACVPPPPPRHWKCSEVKGTGEYQCQTYWGENPGCASCYDTLEECEDGCTTPEVTGCWECSNFPNFEPVFVEGQEPNGTTCLPDLTAVSLAIANGEFCVAPPRYLYQGCGCMQLPNTFYIFPNNGESGSLNNATFATLTECETWSQENCDFNDGGGDDDNSSATWITDSIGVLNGFQGTGTTTQGGETYPYYTSSNFPSNVLAGPNASIFTSITQQTQAAAPRLMLVPIYWPGASLASENLESWGSYKIGSNMEFTMIISVNKNQSEQENSSPIYPFGQGATWAQPNLTELDHNRMFYYINRNNVLQDYLSLSGCSLGSSDGENALTDNYSGNGADRFIDYVSISPNSSYVWGAESGSAWLYYVDVKFDYDLAISQGGATASQMPSMVGKMFYIPFWINKTMGVPIPGTEQSDGTNNIVNIQFIPAEEPNVYVSAADAFGQPVQATIGQGVAGTINPCNTGCD